MIIFAIVAGAVGGIVGVIGWVIATVIKDSKQHKNGTFKSDEAEHYKYEGYTSSSKEDDIASQVAKGVRDGIARSQLEHGESIGNYGLSDLWFK